MRTNERSNNHRSIYWVSYVDSTKHSMWMSRCTVCIPTVVSDWQSAAMFAARRRKSNVRKCDSLALFPRWIARRKQDIQLPTGVDFRDENLFPERKHHRVNEDECRRANHRHGHVEDLGSSRFDRRETRRVCRIHWKYSHWSDPLSTWHPWSSHRNRRQIDSNSMRTSRGKSTDGWERDSSRWNSHDICRK